MESLRVEKLRISHFHWQTMVIPMVTTVATTQIECQVNEQTMETTTPFSQAQETSAQQEEITNPTDHLPQ